jgi:hypothetical protein
MAHDERDRPAKEPDTGDERQRRIPPAGPHATKDLMNEDATPGAGSLPDDEGGHDEAGGTG